MTLDQSNPPTSHTATFVSSTNASTNRGGSRQSQQNLVAAYQSQLQTLSDSLRMVAALDRATDVSAAAVIATNHLKRILGAKQVALRLNGPHGQAALWAVSDVEQVDHDAESNKLIKNACSQAILAQQKLTFQETQANRSAPALALENYCRANSLPACVNLPLMTQDGRTIGAVLIGITEKQFNNPDHCQAIDNIVAIMAGHLDVVVRANQSLGQATVDQFRKLRSSIKLPAVLMGLVATLAILCVPLPYRVACDCEIQPVMRRFIAAPHAGILEKTLVDRGDLVESDQTLAHLDGRQLRIELSGLRAEYDGARKRRDSALAQGDVALSQIARSEMQRHQASIELLDRKLANLEVRSPIAGIVVAGDLEQAEGAPLETGQTLFEIAPLDQMVAEIGIPESEIQYVQPGMDVSLKLTAFPRQTWTGTIKKIRPRTEIINDESVFVAEIELANSSGLLRPGMKGAAKITSKSAPIGWNLFHQAWESVRHWMIW